MIKPFFRKSLIALLSLGLVVAGYKVAEACAGGEWYVEDRLTFTPEAFVADTTLSPFFYSEQFYYGIGHCDDSNTRFADTNVEEWQAYLGVAIDAATIRQVLYHTDRAALLKLADALDKGAQGLPDSLRSACMVLSRGGQRGSRFVSYMLLAREAERYAVDVYEYYWDYDKRELPVKEELNGLGERLAREFKAAPKGFLRERLWFQLVRYGFFYDPEQAVKTYEAHKAEFAPGNMFYRTMSYAAGAYRKMGQSGQANYLYSLVFSGNKRMRTAAHWSFKPQAEEDWQQTLDLARTPEEKAVLWQMLGIFYADEMRSMRQIYALMPGSDCLDVLLTRYVNAYEHLCWDYDDEKSEAEIKRHADSVRLSRQTDLRWIADVAKGERTSNPFLWYVSAGYLYFLGGDSRAAADCYARAEHFVGNGADRRGQQEALAEAQIRLLKLINTIKVLKKVDKRAEDLLCADLTWLLLGDDKPQSLRVESAAAWVRKQMAALYRAQGLTVKAECFDSRDDYYKESEHLQAYLAFMTQKSYTPYEMLCRRIAQKTERDVYDYMGVTETMKNGDLSLAFRWLKMSGDSVVLPGNPFNGGIKDCHDCDHRARQKVKYTKGSFVSKLIEMRANIENQKEVYNNALLLGNAFYNMSFYGNARYFYEGNIVGLGMSSPEYISETYRPMLTDNSMAYKYYTLALRFATDDEQRAKCYYLRAKCERNKWYNDTFYRPGVKPFEYYDYQGPDFLTWTSFKALKDYAHTDFYREAIAECGYFRKVMQR